MAELMPTYRPSVLKPLTRSEEKRAQIVAAASEMFVESGYGDVSMDAIASRANVSKRTVYSHFEDKAGLFVGVMEMHCEFISESMDFGKNASVLAPYADGVDPDDLAADPRALLIAFGTHFMAVIMTESAVRLYRVVLSEVDRFPDLGERFMEAGPNDIARKVTNYLCSQIEEGRLSIADPERAAWRLLAEFKEPMHMAVTLGTIAAPPIEEVRAHITAVVDDFLDWCSVK